MLQEIGELLRTELRGDTPVGRIGGEEFAVLLPGERLAGAYAAAERLRGKVSRLDFDGVQVTASFGVAERLPAGDTLCRPARARRPAGLPGQARRARPHRPDIGRLH